MSRTRIVKGNIYEVVEEHLNYYSKADILETASLTYTENSETDILYGGDPGKAPSAELVNYYIKVRIYDLPVVDPANPPKKYNGEFGFDWIDVDPSSEEVQKIQDIDFSNVEYFYKKGATANDLGDIIAKSTDEAGAKNAIEENYRLSECPKPCKNGKIDMPFVLIKPGQEISLSLEVTLTGGVLNNEKIYLEGNDCYSFELTGGTKTGNRTEKTIADKEIVVLKIKCLKESPETTFKIKQENPTIKLETVGGFTMMENKVLKLKFRVIALVANEPAASSKAQTLFQKFKDNKVKEYLNENSLNQAGYEVEIENQAMFDTLGSGDLDDYFYAFDKTDWTNEKFYKVEKRQQHKLDAKGYGIKKVDGSWEMEDYEAETLFQDIKKDTGKKDTEGNVIMETLSIDNIVLNEYENKLKNKSKFYSGGLIILGDAEAMDLNLAAFSRTTPFNYYSLFIYAKTNYKNDLYAHEIGHMLGLNHIFYSGEEGFEKVWQQLEILKTNIRGIQGETGKFDISSITTTRTKIISALNKVNANISTDLEKRKRDYRTASQANGNFTFGGVSMTKEKFLKKSKDVIDSLEKQKKSNDDAIKEFNNKRDNVYIDFTKKDCSEYSLLAIDYMKIKEDYMKFYANFLSKNSLIYKQASTKNIMDYHNTRIFYQYHQILTMRKDYENY